MKIISTKFSGLKIIHSKIHKDSRGFFKEDFKKKNFKKKNFVFGCTSSSKKNVLRGLHLQTKFSQEKHLSVLKGSILDVVVDLRSKSKTFGKYFKISYYSSWFWSWIFRFSKREHNLLLLYKL